jgi:hypothetical protein
MNNHYVKIICILMAVTWFAVLCVYLYPLYLLLLILELPFEII